MMTSVSAKTYLTDTTFWEDYFVKEDKNVQKWAKDNIASGNSPIVVPTVVLTEFIRRLYYVHKKDPKAVRLAMHYMTNIFRSVIFPNFSEQSVKEIVRLLDKLPVTPPCDIGEISFLNLVNDPNIITVSSDSDVLTVYVFAERLDPRQDPPTHLSRGETYSSG